MKVEPILSSIGGESFDLIYGLDIKKCDFHPKKNRIRQVPQLELLLSSSMNAVLYSKESRKKWSKLDPYILSQYGQEFLLWHYEAVELEQRSPQDELIKYGYSHKATFEIDCLDSDLLCARFYILFKDKVLIDELEKLAFIKAQLAEAHHLLYDIYREYLNPFLDYRIVSGRDMLLLSHLAHGTNRNEIAAACSLTTRGLDYRLNRLKEKFSAKNSAHLMRIAAENNLIRALSS